MIITVTSLRLRSLWKFFVLSWMGLKIVQQTKRQSGFVTIRNTGFGYDHYTLSVWKTEADLKEFARTGAHLEAMKNSRRVATEIRTYTFHADSIPDWKEAKELVKTKGKVFKVA